MNKHPITLLTAAGWPERRTAHRRRGDIAGSHARRLCERRQIDQPEYRQRKQRAAIPGAVLAGERAAPENHLAAGGVAAVAARGAERTQRSAHHQDAGGGSPAAGSRVGVLLQPARNSAEKHQNQRDAAGAANADQAVLPAEGHRRAKGQVWQEKLVFRKSGGAVTVDNPTPFYITLTGMTRQTQNRAAARSAVFSR